MLRDESQSLVIVKIFKTTILILKYRYTVCECATNPQQVCLLKYKFLKSRNWLLKTCLNVE